MRRPPLVVGMPVYQRAWILPRWFDSFEAQDPPEGTVLVFGYSPSDDATERVIYERCRRGGWRVEILDVYTLPRFGDDERDAPGRFVVLADIRNRILRRVAALSPEFYLSWDSDIVLRPGALEELVRVAREPLPGRSPFDVDAVGALVDMGGEHFPGHWSYMMMAGDEPYRIPARPNESVLQTAAPFQADVICGVKLMKPRAYRMARYAPDPDEIWGEDVGWAIQCREMGIALWVAPKARGVHHYRLPSGSEPTTSRNSSR